MLGSALWARLMNYRLASTGLTIVLECRSTGITSPRPWALISRLVVLRLVSMCPSVLKWLRLWQVLGVMLPIPVLRAKTDSGLRLRCRLTVKLPKLRVGATPM